MDLPTAFALVSAGAVALYVLADGFDLGVGVLFLLAPRDLDRDVMMRSVAPLWDGNETWLVFGGALLWAAFPSAYYILLPAFYLPVFLMLFALVLRGVAFEFRFQAGSRRWLWDVAFAGGSLLAVVAQGFVLGGFICGVPVAHDAYAGGPFGCVTVLGLLCSVGLVGGYALLGAGWLIWRTDGATQTFGREVGHAAVILASSGMVLVSGWTALTVPEASQRWFTLPGMVLLAPLPVGAGLTAFLAWRSLWAGDERRVFGLGIVLFLLGFAGLAASLWPYVVPRHATIWSASADDTSLRFLSVGVVVVMPVVLSYLARTYWVFRGKTAADGYDDHAPPRAVARSAGLGSGSPPV